MKTYLIVDAYNVINQWSSLKELSRTSLEDARTRLVSIIQNYAKLKDYYFVIVFDAYNNDDKIYVEELENGYIAYSDKNQTADSYIEKLVYDIPFVYDIMVVTSDYAVQRMVLAAGASRVTSLELEKDVEFTLRNSMKKAKKNYSQGRNHLEMNLDSTTIHKLENIRKGKHR